MKIEYHKFPIFFRKIVDSEFRGPFKILEVGNWNSDPKRSKLGIGNRKLAPSLIHIILSIFLLKNFKLFGLKTEHREIFRNFSENYQTLLKTNL